MMNYVPPSPISGAENKYINKVRIIKKKNTSSIPSFLERTEQQFTESKARRQENLQTDMYNYYKTQITDQTPRKETIESPTFQN